MKELKRMLLIHWHHYEFEVIDFGMINFLTGKTAAGKSTIIDALQLVLLGDTDGSFFNKAANQKSARTLKSYLFGETGDDGETGFHYLREGKKFTSYVALEFYDTQNKYSFVTGIVCDCYRDQNFDRKWFTVNNHGFPDNMYMDPKTDIPYTISELSTYFRQEYGKKSGSYDFTDTNKRYQEISLGKFGQIKPRYHQLLRKAVPFSPISDITQFITESICDIRNDISVDQMQSDIRLYKQLERDAESTQKRIEMLTQIQEYDNAYRHEQDIYRIHDYIVNRALQAEHQTAITALQKEISDHHEKMEQIQKELEQIRLEETEKQSLLQTLQEEYGSSNIVQREKNLSQELEKLNKDIDSMQNAINEAVLHLKEYALEWLSCISNLENSTSPDSELHRTMITNKALLLNMQSLDGESILSYSVDDALSAFTSLHNAVYAENARLTESFRGMTAQKEELERTIASLKSGIKPYGDRITAFRSMLEEKLGRQFGGQVEIPVLADLLEIKNPEWQNAIEGYLDVQRFYLIVPEKYYLSALKIYDEVKEDSGFYDIGLVDVAKLRADAPISKPGSLAEEIESDSPDALLYATYLLGRVMKCNSVSELSRHRTAITQSCMLYKNYVARKLNPSRYSTPFLGRNAIRIQISQNETLLQDITKKLSASEQLLSVLSKATSLSVMSENEAQSYKTAIGRHDTLVQTIQSRDQKQSEYDSLDFGFMQKMKEQINMLQSILQDYEKSKLDFRDQWTRMDEKCRQILDEKLPGMNQQEQETAEFISRQFDIEWIGNVGETRYQEEVNRTRTGSNQSLRERFSISRSACATRMDKQKSQRNRARSDYNHEYHMPYDTEREDNTEFSDELAGLQNIRLPEYMEKIQTAKEKAYTQFRDDFIAKIKSSIEAVSEQLDELNESLRNHQFGTDRYRFEKKPRPEYREYYEMIMDPILLDTGGYNIMSDLFNQKYQREIAQLFDLLILNETDMSSEKRAEYEKNIRKFTDYKTYLVFDLVVTNDHGEEQRLSKTLLKKSGGETQIPFYISLLASFSQVCRVRSREPQNNTIRVIILDEAFSKMDGERIRESINLLRKFKLQAIFSAPPEKISDIAPLVDRNIAVYRDYRHSFTKYFDPKSIDPDLDEEN